MINLLITMFKTWLIREKYLVDYAGRMLKRKKPERISLPD